ncbi:Uncharacterised protein [Moraxella bovis]|uniref:Uncharacterized protein n=2 Tax=Moraxella bovis TaxID=476 RepID=A0A378PNE5_MORBO|nr:Uncharacterised protein [Moraxella bovis]
MGDCLQSNTITFFVLQIGNKYFLFECTMKADQSLFSGVMTDTVNASVGRTMAIEKTINYKGWKGSGYIIIDPHTGSGAYLIDGGANGGIAFAQGMLFTYLVISIMVLSFVSVTVLAPEIGALAWLSLFSILLSTLSATLTMLDVMINKTDFEKNCFIGGVAAMITQLPLPKSLSDKLIGYIIEKVLGIAGASGVTLGWYNCFVGTP